MLNDDRKNLRLPMVYFILIYVIFLLEEMGKKVEIMLFMEEKLNSFPTNINKNRVILLSLIIFFSTNINFLFALFSSYQIHIFFFFFFFCYDMRRKSHVNTNNNSLKVVVVIGWSFKFKSLVYIHLTFELYQQRFVSPEKLYHAFFMIFQKSILPQHISKHTSHSQEKRSKKKKTKNRQ